MEYHVCSNNSLHYYEDLKHNTAIPSRLGYNLKVVIVTDNQTQAEVGANVMFFVVVVDCKKKINKKKQVKLEVQYIAPVITNEHTHN